MKIAGGNIEESIALREYRPRDWEPMHALDVQCFEPEFRFSRRVMRGFAEAPGAMTVLAEAAGELVGFCVVQMEDDVGYVVTLDVSPSWRRRGLGRRMMQEMETKIKATGGSIMALHVFTGNASAMRFYESLGFGRVGRAEGFYGRDLDALVYRKKLET